MSDEFRHKMIEYLSGTGNMSVIVQLVHYFWQKEGAG